MNSPVRGIPACGSGYCLEFSGGHPRLSCAATQHSTFINRHGMVVGKQHIGSFNGTQSGEPHRWPAFSFFLLFAALHRMCMCIDSRALPADKHNNACFSARRSLIHAAVLFHLIIQPSFVHSCKPEEWLCSAMWFLRMC